MRRVCASTLVVLLAPIIVSCGGGDNATPSTDPAPPGPATNTPPTIVGSPPVLVIRDQEYFFAPDASDADGDDLVFSVINQPAWASFDTSNGTLNGTPSVTDIGVTRAVTISVTDGRASASLSPFDIEVQAIPLGSASVSWDAPTTNDDGSLLTDLAGFRVYVGRATRDYDSVHEINSQSSGSMLIDDLEAGRYFFTVTAVDTSGNESSYSAEVVKDVMP